MRKDYIRVLNYEELRELVYFALLEVDQNSQIKYLDNTDIKSIVLDYSDIKKVSCNERFKITAKINSNKNGNFVWKPEFYLDDYNMIMIHGNFKKELNEVLYKYLTAIFGEIYIEDLYQERIELATIENNKLKNYIRTLKR